MEKKTFSLLNTDEIPLGVAILFVISMNVMHNTISVKITLVNLRIFCNEGISGETKFINSNFKLKIWTPDIKRIIFLPIGIKGTNLSFLVQRLNKHLQGTLN